MIKKSLKNIRSEATFFLFFHLNNLYIEILHVRIDALHARYYRLFFVMINTYPSFWDLYVAIKMHEK